jgi:tetratricopeptide (TPR) repeat protein
MCQIGLIWLPLHAASDADMSLGRLPPPKSDLLLTPRGAANADAMAHYSAALQFETAGKLRQALEHYRAVFKADPTNAELASHTAGIALQFEGREAALKILDEAIQANPGSPEPLLNLARFASTYPPEDVFEKDDRAAKAVSTALEKFPRHAAVYEAAVMHHLTQNKRDAAIAVMEQSAKQDSKDPRFWLDLATTAERVWPLGQIEQRTQHLAKVAPFFDKALAFVTPANAEDIQLEVAQHYLLTNELTRSRELCEKLVKEHNSLQARKVLFRMCEASGEGEKSLAMLEAITKQGPDEIDHLRVLAREYEKRDKPDKAIPPLEAAIQQGSGEVNDYLFLGSLLWQTRQFDRMGLVGERAVKIFPEQPLTHFQLALSCRARELHEKAAKHFADAEQLAAASQSELLDHTFYYQYGSTLEHLGRFDDASRMLEKSITLTPREKSEAAANTMNFLGYMWLEQGKDLAKAGELIAKANELSPDNAAYIDSLGWFHFKKGDFAKALAEFQRAEKLIPEIQSEDAEILEHIAVTHKQLGDTKTALDYLERAHALKTPFTKIRERIEKTLKQWKGLGDTEKK